MMERRTEPDKAMAFPLPSRTIRLAQRKTMLTRRSLFATLAAAAFAKDPDYPVRKRKSVEKLYKSPDGNPNALEATADGLWVGEQVTDRAYLVDWKSGKPTLRFETQSSNTSGIAAGGGFVFMAANGPTGSRERRPTDVEKGGRIVKLDAKTGKHIKNFPTPNGGGVHGLLWLKNSLWITQFGPNKNITQTDADLEFIRSFPVPLERAHGLGWDGQHMWCMFSDDYRILKFDINNGRVIEAVDLERSDPDPHGMTWHEGNLYYCDAGIAPGFKDSGSPHSGWICRIHLS